MAILIRPVTVWVILTLYQNSWTLGTVQKPASLLSISPKNVTIKAGRDANFSCVYHRNLTKGDRLIVLWEHDGNLIWLSETGWTWSHSITATITKSNVSVTANLRIKYVIASSSGKYTCTVITNSVHKQITAELKVDTGVSLKSATVGDTVNMTCSSPRSLRNNEFYIWYFNNRILFVNHTRITSNHRILISDNGLILKIVNATMADSGIYRCKIIHLDVKMVSLKVKAPPATPKPTKKPSGKETEKWKIYTGVAGGAVVLILIITAAIWFCWRKKE